MDCLSPRHDRYFFLICKLHDYGEFISRHKEMDLFKKLLPGVGHCHQQQYVVAILRHRYEILPSRSEAEIEEY